MKNNNFPIKSFVRIRPSKKHLEYTTTSIKVTRKNNTQTEFFFDKVLGPSTTQITMYKNISEYISKFEEGYNSTIFCYGNTGAGKTYTMMGTKESPGLIINIIKGLLIKEPVSISYMEIYNEKIYDLLNPRELILREQDNKIVVNYLTSRNICDFEEFIQVFNLGNSNRKIGETKLNKFSSRSHTILRVSRGQCKLQLIDLAGSENNRKTGNEGLRLEESNNINKSLFVLGQVVNSILRKEKRIPYRDSKLTRLLQDSLGGESLCCIIANIIDDVEYTDETINTLKFASKSRKIVNFARELHDTKKKIEIVSRKLMDKTNTPKKRRKKEDSTLSNRSEVLMTPNTQEKSYKAFLLRAEEYEREGEFRKALEEYKTVKKIKDNLFIQEKIDNINKIIGNSKIRKQMISKRELLDVFNSGNFLSIKKIKGIGDKRAQSIVDFISGGNFFESLEDLKLIFSEKVYKTISDSLIDI